MAASLFTLLDDIASMLDDVALMTKLAAKKTAGVVGDDLALNANQVTGASAERELPIVWAVAKGSLFNKVILIIIALLLAQFAPFLITPLLLLGGTYLCFEGVEKIWHKIHHTNDTPHKAISDNLDSETQKIKGAIRTDFILSAEIIIIALGEMQRANWVSQALALSLVGLGITVAVYGLVALIVKADDLGLHLLKQTSRVSHFIGNTIILAMPYFMRLLSIFGTLAMFLVGGGIFTHSISMLHAMNWHNVWLNHGLSLLVGIIVGIVACLIILPFQKIKRSA